MFFQGGAAWLINTPSGRFSFEALWHLMQSESVKATLPWHLPQLFPSFISSIFTLFAPSSGLKGEGWQREHPANFECVVWLKRTSFKNPTPLSKSIAVFLSPSFCAAAPSMEGRGEGSGEGRGLCAIFSSIAAQSIKPNLSRGSLFCVRFSGLHSMRRRAAISLNLSWS